MEIGGCGRQSDTRVRVRQTDDNSDKVAQLFSDDKSHIDLADLVSARSGLRAEGYNLNKRFAWNTVQGTFQANRQNQTQRMWKAHDNRVELEVRKGIVPVHAVDADFDERRKAAAERLRRKQEELEAERAREIAEEAAEDAAAAAAAAAAGGGDDADVQDVLLRTRKRGRGDVGAAMDAVDAAEAGREGDAGGAAAPPGGDDSDGLGLSDSSDSSSSGRRKERSSKKAKKRSREDDGRGKKKKKHKHQSRKKEKKTKKKRSKSRS